ncbi:MAG TPA: PAS domain S-box protein [Deltaproteobacteria bacterium]|nr:PAS domain S-box protein [Deltaproteobacteria bacterium]
MKEESRSVDRLLDVLAEAKDLVTDFADEAFKSKAAEEALRESEERYRIHFSLTNDVMFSFDRQLTIRSVSPNVERVLGYTPEELTGRTIAESNLLHADDMQEALDNAQHVLAGGVSLSSIFQFVTKNGDILMGEVSGIPLSRDGKVVEVINVARDITKRVNTENALRESSERYLHILDSLPGAVCIIKDEDTRFMFANRAFCALSGHEIRDIIGKTPVELKLPVGLDDFFSSHKPDAGSSQNNLRKQRLKKKDGTVADVFVSSGPMKYGDEDCLIMVMMDVTNYKRSL